MPDDEIATLYDRFPLVVIHQLAVVARCDPPNYNGTGTAYYRTRYTKYVMPPKSLNQTRSPTLHTSFKGLHNFLDERLKNTSSKKPVARFGAGGSWDFCRTCNHCSRLARCR